MADPYREYEIQETVPGNTPQIVTMAPLKPKSTSSTNSMSAVEMGVITVAIAVAIITLFLLVSLMGKARP